MEEFWKEVNRYEENKLKITNTHMEKFPIKFTGENTFICGQGVSLVTVASAELSKLNADNNTVLITDPYLFPNMCNSTEEQQYENDLESLLAGLKAKKIIYCAKNIKNNSMYQRMKNLLQNHGTILIFDQRLDECHDRFWYCPETEKTIVFGTSLNGIGRKICRIDELKDAETSVLKQYFVNAGIL